MATSRPSTRATTHDGSGTRQSTPPKLISIQAGGNEVSICLEDPQLAKCLGAALPKVTPQIAEARARFRLGVWLRAHGRAAEGDRQMSAAAELYPDSWSLWRQAADLDEVGKASGPGFWARVQALWDKPYYPPPKL